jgi:hypothetical protein
LGRSRKDPHSLTEEISAVWRERGEKIVSDNSKCIRTSEVGMGVDIQFPPWGWYGCFWHDPLRLKIVIQNDKIGGVKQNFGRVEHFIREVREILEGLNPPLTPAPQ